MGLRNGKTIELAMKMYNYIKNIPENVLFGIKREKKCNYDYYARSYTNRFYRTQNKSIRKIKKRIS